MARLIRLRSSFAQNSFERDNLFLWLHYKLVYLLLLLLLFLYTSRGCLINLRHHIL